MPDRFLLLLQGSPLMRYSAAIVAVGVATLSAMALQAVNAYVSGMPLLFCATIFSAWLGGMGAGLLAAVLSSAIISVGLLPPPLHGSSPLLELPRAATFALGALFVSWITGCQRRAEAALEQARRELERKVQERTAELRRTNEKLQNEIVEHRRADEALHDMQAQLFRVSRVNMMGELAASIAHEVNQPLGAIMNYANASRRLLAAAGSVPASVEQALNQIAADAHRASEIITRIRAFSQKRPLQKRSVAARELVDDAAAILRQTLQARNVTLRISGGEGLPPLEADRVQVVQVLLNVVVNGLEAMLAVSPAERRIEIRLESAVENGIAGVAFLVRDYGTGVSPADATRLFEPFYSTKEDGMGMGLPISRSIVEFHEGTLGLVPNAGPGATFRIFLPVVTGAAA